MNTATNSKLDSFSVLEDHDSQAQALIPVPPAFEFSLVVLNDLVCAKRNKALTNPELAVILGSLNNLDYEDIASQTSFAVNYLQRCVAPQLWDLLSEVLGEEGGERVGKKRLWYFLAQLNKKYNIQTPLEESAFLLEESTECPTYDETIPVLGAIPEIPYFYGRSKELAHLKLLITEHRCISLVGSPGIGKSLLASKFISELRIESQPRFEIVIWKSVSHAPLLHDLIIDLVTLTKDPLETEIVTSQFTHGMISALIKQLQSRRCLLVLDGFDALFKGNNFVQKLEYGTFLNRLIEENHNSCFLLTSRMLLDEIDIVAKNKSYIKTLQINGLDAKAAKQLLLKLGLKNEEDCKNLIATYRGNPQELKAVGKRIDRFFGGSAKKFLEAKTTLISTELHSILNEMFGQILSNIQRQIMICIAEELFLTCQSISFSRLLEKLKLAKLTVSTSELITAIEKLERLSLVETGKDESTKETWFNLEPVIKKYIKTDPLGLVHTSEVPPKLAIAS